MKRIVCREIMGFPPTVYFKVENDLFVRLILLSSRATDCFSGKKVVQGHRAVLKEVIVAIPLLFYGFMMNIESFDLDLASPKCPQ